MSCIWFPWCLAFFFQLYSKLNSCKLQFSLSAAFFWGALNEGLCVKGNLDLWQHFRMCWNITGSLHEAISFLLQSVWGAAMHALQLITIKAASINENWSHFHPPLDRHTSKQTLCISLLTTLKGRNSHERKQQIFFNPFVFDFILFPDKGAIRMKHLLRSSCLSSPHSLSLILPPSHFPFV